MDKDKIQAFMRSLEDYVRAEIAAAKDTEPDSMGSYYERVALEESLTNLFNQEE